MNKKNLILYVTTSDIYARHPETVFIFVLICVLGLPEIGLEPLDPLKIPKIRILQGEGPVNVNAALDDVTVTGFGKTEVLSSQ